MAFPPPATVNGGGRQGLQHQQPGADRPRANQAADHCSRWQHHPRRRWPQVSINLNRWVNDSLSALDKALPIGKVDTLPDEGQYEGDMVLHEGALWIWNEGAWIEVGGESTPKILRPRFTPIRLQPSSPVFLAHKLIGSTRPTALALGFCKPAKSSQRYLFSLSRLKISWDTSA